MLQGSSVVVFVLGMAAMFLLLYVSLAYSPEESIPTARITQEDALRIADSDLKQRLSDYKGIVGIIDANWTGYVPVAEFEGENMQVALIYAHPNASLLQVTANGTENRGYCNSPTFAYCGWWGNYYNFDYGSRLVYAVELQIDSKEEALVMYMIDATDGRIVDSSFLRSDWIRTHTTDES